MSEVKLKTGDTLYHIGLLHHKLEVIKEDRLCYYAAICKGSSSKIFSISKKCDFEKFGKVWFYTEKESIAYHVKELRRMADYFEKQYLTGKDEL